MVTIFIHILLGTRLILRKSIVKYLHFSKGILRKYKFLLPRHTSCKNIYKSFIYKNMHHLSFVYCNVRRIYVTEDKAIAVNTVRVY